MTMLYSSQGTITFPIKAGNTLKIKNISGVETVSGSVASREDFSTFVVYGPQASDATIQLSTSGQCDYEIVTGYATGKVQETPDLYDPKTGRWLGVIDKAGKEQLVESVYGPVQDFGSTSGARAINCEKGDVCSLTIAGPTTLSFTNLPTYNTSLRVTLVITNGGSSVTWPAGTRWAGPGVVGSAPTLAATGVDKVVMEINNIAGTIYYDAAYIGRVA